MGEKSKADELRAMREKQWAKREGKPVLEDDLETLEEKPDVVRDLSTKKKREKAKQKKR